MLYHVLSRSNSGDSVFKDTRDRNKFLSYLIKYAALFEFRIHVWCLVSTHFHLLIETTQQASLSEMMRRLLTAYTVYFNRRHGRHGHLFQGRFKSLVVDRTEYLLALSRYIHLNPMTGSQSINPETYTGSSLHYYIHGKEPSWLYTKEILDWFGGDRRLYAKFVREGLCEDTKIPIYHQKFVGGEHFAKRIWKRMETAEKRKQSTSQSDSSRKDMNIIKAEVIVKKVADYFSCTPQIIRNSTRIRGTVGKARTAAIGLLREELPWMLKQIGEYMNIRSIDCVKYHLKQIQNEKEMQQLVNHIKKR